MSEIPMNEYGKGSVSVGIVELLDMLIYTQISSGACMLYTSFHCVQYDTWIAGE